MALPTDRVQALKVESSSLGGDDADAQPFNTPIEPQEDALEAAGLYLQDAANRDENVLLYRGGNDIVAKMPGILAFNGVTASEAGFKQVGATIQCRLGTDGDYAIFACDYPTADDHAATKKYVDDNGLSGSGAANQVAYWSGASVLTGGANFTWDGSSCSITGSVGINRSAPTSYQIAATSAAAGSAGFSTANTTSTGRAELITRNDGGVGFETGVWGSNVGSAWGETLSNAIYFRDKATVSKMLFVLTSQAPMHFITDDEKRLTIAGLGNVGVGTDDPQERFHAYSESDTPGLFERNSSYTTDITNVLTLVHTSAYSMGDGFGSELLFQSRDDSDVLNNAFAIRTSRDGADNTHQVIFRTYDAGVAQDKVIIDPNGHVGIGRDPGGSYQLLTEADAASAAGMGMINTGTGTGSRAEFIARNNNSEGFELGVYGTGVTGSAWSETLASSLFFRDNNTVSKALFVLSSAAPFIFVTNDLQRLRIEGDGNVLVSTGRLIYGEATASGASLKRNGTGLSVRTGNDGDYSNLSCDYPTLDDHAATKEYVDDNTGGLSGGAADKLAIWSGASALTYESGLHWDDVNGRLGIGTDSPEKTFHCIGTSGATGRFERQTSLTNSVAGVLHIVHKTDQQMVDGFGTQLLFQAIDTDDVANNAGNIYTVRASTDNTHDIRVKVYDGGVSADVMTFDHEGLVGIGTIDPQALLHVGRNLSSSTDVYVSNTHAGAGALSRVELESDTAQVQLDAFGSGSGTTWAGESLASAVALTSGASSTKLIIGTKGADPLYLATDATKRLSISSDGDIGVGSSPITTYRMRVFGDATSASGRYALQLVQAAEVATSVRAGTSTVMEASHATGAVTSMYGAQYTLWNLSGSSTTPAVGAATGIQIEFGDEGETETTYGTIKGVEIVSGDLTNAVTQYGVYVDMDTSVVSGAAHCIYATSTSGSAVLPEVELTSGLLHTAEVAAPGTPAGGWGVVYAKTDGKVYFKNDGGTEYDLTAGGLSVSGTGIANRLAYWTDANTISADSNLVWTAATDRMGIGMNSAASSRLHLFGESEDVALTIEAENDGYDVSVVFWQDSRTAYGQIGYDDSVGSFAIASEDFDSTTSTLYVHSEGRLAFGATAANSSYGVYFKKELIGDTGTQTGFRNEHFIAGASAGTKYGIYNYIRANHTSGTLSNLYGQYTNVYDGSSSASDPTITTVYGQMITIGDSTNAKWTTVYGLRVSMGNLQDVSGNAYGVYVDNVDDGQTGSYAIYTNAGDVRLYGSTEIGGQPNGYSSMSATNRGLYLTGRSMDLTGKYTPALTFACTDTAFTTETPKVLATIVGRATEAYSADTHSGMAIDFFVSPQGGGTSGTTELGMSLDENGLRLANVLELAEVAEPATPAAGYGRIYAETDGKLYFKNDAGTEYDLTVGAVSGGSAGNIAFWTGASTLSNSSNLNWDNTNAEMGVGLANISGRTLAVAETFRVKSTGAMRLDIDANNDATGVALDVDNGGFGFADLFFKNNGTQTMVLTDDGEIGMGANLSGGGGWGRVCIQDGTLTGATANASVDSLVIDGTNNNGITMLTANTASSYIGFGDPQDSYVGAMRYAHTDNSLAFMTNNAYRMYIDSSGNVGIGSATVGNIDGQLHIADGLSGATASTYSNQLVLDSNGSYTGMSILGSDYCTIDFGDSANASIGSIQYRHSNNLMRFIVNNAERLSIDSGGDVGIGFSGGTTATYRLDVKDAQASYVARFFNDGNSTGYHGLRVQCGADTPSGTYTTYYMLCEDGNGTDIGYVADQNTNFNTYDPSDARLKEDIAPTKVCGLEMVKALQVREFRKKRNLSLLHTCGFVAQECQAVFPEMVNEGPERADGNRYLAVSKEMLVPVLTKAVQEQQELIDEQQAKLAEQESVMTNLVERVEALEAA